MDVCVFVCLRARVRVCVCVSVYVGGKGCFMGRGSYLLHIPHIIYIYIYMYIYIYTYMYIYIYIHTCIYSFHPPVVRMSGEKSADDGTADFQGQFNED